jgi:hypothetical protein
MARLPVVGGDAGNWGTILNTFLSVSLFTDGTLNSGVVGSTQLASGAVGATQANLPSLAGGMLLSGTLAAIPTAASTNSGFFYIATDANGGTLYRSNGSAWTQIAGGVSQGQAPTGAVSGGDLTGSYPGPTIAKIQGATISGSPSSGAAVVATSGTAAAWTVVPTTGANTFTGNQTAPAVVVSGLTGAVAASRYVGATASVAPTTGSFVVGDFVISQNGKIWVCTTLGSPGTWTQVGGGVSSFNARTGAVVPVSGDYTAAQVTNAADKSSASAQAFTGNISTSGTLSGSKSITAGVVALTDGTTISVDASQGSHFRVVIAGNRTLSNPTNPTDGQKITFEIIQDATGTRTLAYGTAYAFSTDIPLPTLTTTPNKRDMLGFVYNASTSLWYLLAVVHGF